MKRKRLAGQPIFSHDLYTAMRHLRSNCASNGQIQRKWPFCEVLADISIHHFALYLSEENKNEPTANALEPSIFLLFRLGSGDKDITAEVFFFFSLAPNDCNRTCNMGITCNLDSLGEKRGRIPS